MPPIIARSELRFFGWRTNSVDLHFKEEWFAAFAGISAGFGTLYQARNALVTYDRRAWCWPGIFFGEAYGRAHGRSHAK